MPWRVTQYNERGHFVHAKTYRFKFMAVFSAWMRAGKGSALLGDPDSEYYTTVKEVPHD